MNEVIKQRKTKPEHKDMNLQTSIPQNQQNLTRRLSFLLLPTQTRQIRPSHQKWDQAFAREPERMERDGKHVRLHAFVPVSVEKSRDQLG